MRASLASLLVTSLALTSVTASTADAGPRRPKKSAKKAPKQDKAPAPDAQGAPAADGTGAVPPTAAPPSPAPGPAPAPTTEEAKAQAKALGKDATRLYNVQKYEQAADLYQQAYLLDPNPAYLYAAAQSQRLGGDCNKALQSYQAYLRANPPESERAKAQANIDRCTQELQEREAAVNADQIKPPVEVPAPPPPPPEEKPVVIVKLAPPPGKTYVLGHIMLGVGVIALGGGSYLFYSGRKTIDDHNSAATYQDYIAGLSDVDGAKRNQTVGLVVAGGGAALIGGAVLYYVLHSRSRDEAAPPVQASVTPTGATVSFTRNF